MTEEFRPATTDDRYLVSNRGRVWSVRSQKYLKPFAADSGGHLAVHLPGGRAAVHRLVAFTFIGPPQQGHEVRHLKNVPNDNRVENLAWGTRAQNVLDLRKNKTRCPHGHEYTLENTWYQTNGHRRCRACKLRYR